MSDVPYSSFNSITYVNNCQCSNLLTVLKTNKKIFSSCYGGQIDISNHFFISARIFIQISGELLVVELLMTGLATSL